MLLPSFSLIKFNLCPDYSHHPKNLYIHGVFQAQDCQQRKKNIKTEEKGAIVA